MFSSVSNARWLSSYLHIDKLDLKASLSSCSYPFICVYICIYWCSQYSPYIHWIYKLLSISGLRACKAEGVHACLEWKQSWNSHLTWSKPSSIPIVQRIILKIYMLPGIIKLQTRRFSWSANIIGVVARERRLKLSFPGRWHRSSFDDRQSLGIISVVIIYLVTLLKDEPIGDSTW